MATTSEKIVSRRVLKDLGYDKGKLATPAHIVMPRPKVAQTESTNQMMELAGALGEFNDKLQAFAKSYAPQWKAKQTRAAAIYARQLMTQKGNQQIPLDEAKANGAEGLLMPGQGLKSMKHQEMTPDRSHHKPPDAPPLPAIPPPEGAVEEGGDPQKAPPEIPAPELKPGEQVIEEKIKDDKAVGGDIRRTWVVNFKLPHDHGILREVELLNTWPAGKEKPTQDDFKHWTLLSGEEAEKINKLSFKEQIAKGIRAHVPSKTFWQITDEALRDIISVDYLVEELELAGKGGEQPLVNMNNSGNPIPLPVEFLPVGEKKYPKVKRAPESDFLNQMSHMVREGKIAQGHNPYFRMQVYRNLGNLVTAQKFRDFLNKRIASGEFENIQNPSSPTAALAQEWDEFQSSTLGDNLYVNEGATNAYNQLSQQFMAEAQAQQNKAFKAEQINMDVKQLTASLEAWWSDQDNLVKKEEWQTDVQYLLESRGTTGVSQVFEASLKKFATVIDDPATSAADAAKRLENLEKLMTELEQLPIAEDDEFTTLGDTNQMNPVFTQWDAEIRDLKNRRKAHDANKEREHAKALMQDLNNALFITEGDEESIKNPEETKNWVLNWMKTNEVPSELTGTFIKMGQGAFSDKQRPLPSNAAVVKDIKELLFDDHDPDKALEALDNAMENKDLNYAEYINLRNSITMLRNVETGILASGSRGVFAVEMKNLLASLEGATGWTTPEKHIQKNLLSQAEIQFKEEFQEAVLDLAAETESDKNPSSKEWKAEYKRVAEELREKIRDSTLRKLNTIVELSKSTIQIGEEGEAAAIGDLELDFASGGAINRAMLIGDAFWGATAVKGFDFATMPEDTRNSIKLARAELLKKGTGLHGIYGKTEAELVNLLNAYGDPAAGWPTPTGGGEVLTTAKAWADRMSKDKHPNRTKLDNTLMGLSDAVNYGVLWKFEDNLFTDKITLTYTGENTPQRAKAMKDWHLAKMAAGFSVKEIKDGRARPEHGGLALPDMANKADDTLVFAHDGEMDAFTREVSNGKGKAVKAGTIAFLTKLGIENERISIGLFLNDQRLKMQIKKGDFTNLKRRY